MARIELTLTGADERTPLADLVRLAEMGAEIGLLYTFDPEGRNRYPSLAWIDIAARALEGRAALHVCGQRARGDLFLGRLDEVAKRVRRMQLNGTVDCKDIRSVCEMFPRHTVITQHTPENAPLLDLELANHALLVDGSGGRGIKPDVWLRPATSKPTGFAGGLGPRTLFDELPKILAVAQPGAWIDLESGLRDSSDWFDVSKAIEVMGVWRAITRGE